MSVFRANGTTSVVGSVSECEPINYRAVLQKATAADTLCAFSGGTFRLMTPDGVVHDIDLNVPCVGGNTGLEGCDDTIDFVQSALIPYTVSPGDVVGGFITATATYTGGVLHDTPENTPGAPASTPKSAPVVLCEDNDLCTSDVCDPTEPGSAACRFHPVGCNDNNACTADTCNPANGICVFTPVVCDDNSLCTSDDCDPAIGTCVFTPTLDCNDDDVCTVDTCDPALGCAHTAGISCDDNEVCTDDSCHPTLGCQNVPNNNPACLNHFQCYEIKPFSFPRQVVTVEDRYGEELMTIRSPNRLCAPSDKRGEDPTAATDPEHLTSYPTSGSTVRIRNQTITNQFGTVTLDLIHRSFLFVPTAKSVVGPVPPLQDPALDHFQCHLVRPATGQPRFQSIPGITAVDQFGSHTMDLLRPRYFCVPANKNDENPGALTHTQNLLCYKARQRVRFPTLEPFIENEFVDREVDIIRRMEFCVPSTIAS